MLRAVIVGGGIAGLSAGVALRRAGHTVHIYERSHLNNEVGAAINVPPNASRFLVGSWGLDPARNRFVRARTISWCDPFTAEVESTHSHEKNLTRFGADLWLAHRVDLHSALRRLATDPEAGPGAPVVLHPGSQVVGYDPDAPSVTLASGEVVKGDLVIGADGIHSAAAEAVLGYENTPVTPAHYNYCYRFLIPASTLEADPETRFWNVGTDGKTRLFADVEQQRRLVAYVCRDNTIHNFVGLYYDDSTTSVKKEDYLASVDKMEVLERFSGYHPSILAVVKAPIPTWRRDQGQGGAQGMEDAVALGIVLHGVSAPEEIEERLELFQRIRRNRACAIQILSNVGSDQSHLVYEDLKEFLAESKIPTNPADIFSFNYKYDVVKASIEALRQFTKTRAPPSSKDINTQAVGDVRENLVDSAQLTAAVH